MYNPFKIVLATLILIPILLFDYLISKILFPILNMDDFTGQPFITILFRTVIIGFMLLVTLGIPISIIFQEELKGGVTHG